MNIIKYSNKIEELIEFVVHVVFKKGSEIFTIPLLNIIVVSTYCGTDINAT